jgi:internalin A
MLAVSTLTEEDAQMLAYFDALEELDATGCLELDAVAAFRDRNPQCRVTYQVILGGEAYPQDTAVLELEDASADELLEKLTHLPTLTSVFLRGELPEMAQIRRLQETFPEVEFHWEFTFEGIALSDETAELDLSGRELNYAETARVMGYLPNLTHANMTGCSLTDQELMALADSVKDCFFLWEMTFGDFLLSTAAEEIDISGTALESVEPVEDLLPYFPNLKKIVMCKCGIDDETMDALNKRHEDVRFVWSVRIKYVDVRTDATWFYPFKFDRDMTVNNKDLYPLRYCTDMVCIDIGHMVEVTDCEWAAFMPNLKYFIIGETAISDLSPLSGLKNLEYFEMFTVPVTDYSPLLGCTGLKDLNLGKTYAPAAPIAQMTWLENLWWCDCATKGNPCSDAPEILPEALPNTTLRLYGAHPTAAGWRQLPNYFAMRDFMGMFYLT